jgi:hypothetical protein
MLHFLRRIRRSLINTGSIRKYLLYAIGEIVLVVIGIFIAIQLNIIFQTAKDSHTELDYLNGMLSNLDQNIDELQGNAKTDSLKIMSLTQILRSFTVDSIKSNDTLLRKIISNSLPIHAFKGDNVVFEDMKSSGKIIFIQSDSLRLAVQSYYRQFREVKERESQNNIVVVDYRNKSINASLDINSVIESRFPEERRAEISPFDASFFDKSINSLEVIQFSNNISTMKGILSKNGRLRSSLLDEAMKLKIHIAEYLSRNTKE